ncbi:MAG: NAD(P)-dependent oxidoreductase [Acetobacteraceae bacterium]|nr:NAD(P)-dependent oxidoreductase [Acetobacteraceae bacterium]
MRVLLTGASSFTGHWFARHLSAAGATVVATLSGAAAGYGGGHARRLARLPPAVARIHAAPFGSDAMLAAIRAAAPLDALCHHWAHMTGYTRPDFPVEEAVAANTRNLGAVLDALREAGGTRIVVTGSYGEPGEGAGPETERSFSPYATSKAVTFARIREAALARGLRVDKFVIPNPFGPEEEPRFTAYLMREWAAGRVPEVRTPAYVRDNIPVGLLARAYARLVLERPASGPEARLAPGFYAGAQGDFAARVAREVSARTGWRCDLRLAAQTDFPEPRARWNPDRVDAAALGFDEAAAWDDFTRFHTSMPAAV